MNRYVLACSNSARRAGNLPRPGHTRSARSTGVRMDVCAFVGVAPRGPARVPVVDERWRDDRPCVEPERPRRRTVAVAVESFDEYRRLFGGFEGPGLLPYAVAVVLRAGRPPRLRRAHRPRLRRCSERHAGGVAHGDRAGRRR